MSTAPKRPLSEILPIAEALRAELAPLCQRIEIAGSIRRKKAECSDVELVCIPIIRDEWIGGELFGRKLPVNHVVQYIGSKIAHRDRFELRLDKNGRASKGDKYIRLQVDSVGLDLFLTTPAQWGLIFVIRTGPWEFSRNVVTQRSKGGLLPSHMRVRDGSIWANDAMVPTPEEDDVFRVLQVSYVQPGYRR